MAKPVKATAVALLATYNAETQAAIPTLTLTLPSPTAIPESYYISTPGPDQQIYIDPDGWYAIYFPDNMKSQDKPNYFYSPEGTLETGYLTEMGYMPDDVSICTWLANMELEPEISGVDWYTHPCSAISEDQSGYKIRFAIQENLGADPEHRFIYIKSGGYIPWPQYTFTWLKYVPRIRPKMTPEPLSAEESAFWEKSITLPDYISVHEYKLPPPPEYLPLNELPENPFQYIPTSTPTSPVRIPEPSPTPRKITLEDIGYELRTLYTP
ncbi:MAG: hypothetical protein AB1750_02195, partial [Chloroflexota bacterium]